MCRRIVFSGTCSHCAGGFVWEELSQELSCLEAKNAGVFGQCRRGVQVEEHRFDQECDPCTAEMEADEGYGAGIDDFDDLDYLVAAGAKKSSGGETMNATMGVSTTKGKKATADSRFGDGRQHKKQRIS